MPISGNGYQPRCREGVAPPGIGAPEVGRYIQHFRRVTPFPLPPPTNISDLRNRARRRVPRFVFDYVEGGADDEVTLRSNRLAFERHAFVPRVLQDVGT